MPDMPVHVVHIVESFASGCLTSVATLCCAVRDGFRHSVIHSLRPETPTDFARLFPDDVEFYFVPMTREIRLASDMNAFRRLYALLGRSRPDIVHCHSSKAGFIGRFAARSRGLPSVYTPRAYSFLRTDVSRLQCATYMAAEWVAARAGTAVVACGKEEYELSLKLVNYPFSVKTDKSHVYCVNNAVNLEELDAAGRIVSGASAAGCGTILAGTCGRLGVQHDPELFSALAEALQEVAWVWIDAPKEAAEPCSLSPRVERTGWLGRDDARALVAGLDIYVHTSLWEGLSIAVLEAMALARPVVATDIPANRAIVEHGVTGFLGSTAEELAAHVRRLAADADLRRHMGRAARQYVQNHHDDAGTFQTYSHIYRSLAVGAGRA